MALDVVRLAAVAFDEGGGAGPAAEGFQAVDAGTGKDVEEWPAGNRVAEDAEEGFPNHLRGRPQAGVDGHGQLAAPQAPGHDAELRAVHGVILCRRGSSDGVAPCRTREAPRGNLPAPRRRTASTVTPR